MGPINAAVVDLNIQARLHICWIDRHCGRFIGQPGFECEIVDTGVICDLVVNVHIRSIRFDIRALRVCIRNLTTRTGVGIIVGGIIQRQAVVGSQTDVEPVIAYEQLDIRRIVVEMQFVYPAPAGSGTQETPWAVDQ